MAKKDAEENPQMAAISSPELTDAEKATIEAAAREEVIADLKAAAMEKYKEQAKLKIQGEMMFRAGKNSKGKDTQKVVLDLASYPKFIILDGAVYHSGKTYNVDSGVAAVLRDQMDRGWTQEASRMGEKIVDVNHRRKVLGRNGLQLQ